jgi:hypothetical protein
LLFEKEMIMARARDGGTASPKPSRMEAKGDATTRAARQIIDAEAAAEAAKTARLRAARLARSAAEASAPAVKAKPKAKAKKKG